MMTDLITQHRKYAMTLIELSQTLDAILDTADCDPKTMARLEELNHELYKASHPTPEDMEG